MVSEFFHRKILFVNICKFVSLSLGVGLPPAVIQQYALQLVQALCYLSTRQSRVIHCDLKPENILIADLEHKIVKVGDFGSACWLSQAVTGSYIQSRWYRSPEVLLSMPFGQPIE